MMNMKKLSDPVSVLGGVGPKRQQALAHLGINSILDLLLDFPVSYNDFRPRKLSTVANGSKVTLKGTVVGEPRLNYYGYHKSRLNFRIISDHNLIRVTFFNRPWLKRRLSAQRSVLVYGTFNRFQQSLNGIRLLNQTHSRNLEGIYRSSHSIHQSTIQHLVKSAYQKYHQLIYSYVPRQIIQHYKLEPELTVVHDLHFPKSDRDRRLALRTAKFNEFFLFQMRLQIMKKIEDQHRGVQIHYRADLIHRLIKSLPYQLTAAQRKVIGEIDYDLSRPVQMNRLLQGDVGSGKTIVAAIAIYATITAGYQAALMAPTEILAKQHANNFFRIFSKLGINVALLTGSTKLSARKELLPRLADGQINLIIGTHALIQPKVKYYHLGLVVIDEQHRFGVNQRRALRKKGRNPNVLAMTATPIPRTLALTAYGDMDVSIIDQLPAGRKQIVTKWYQRQQFPQVMSNIRRFLSTGQQIYVVAPLIQPSSTSQLTAATDLYRVMSRYLAPHYRVELLDGQMSDEKKNQIMTDFQRQKFQVLVSTTVIEVGVDVANANLMVIFDADHFGLSQLHQLRGRVGRSKRQAYCFLIANPKGRNGKQRMKIMTETNNGFLISQRDLELRGPGNVLGKVQSGIPQFKIGDPIKDEVILSCAQHQAIRVVDEPKWRHQSANLNLVRRLRFNQTSVLD